MTMLVGHHPSYLTTSFSSMDNSWRNWNLMSCQETASPQRLESPAERDEEPLRHGRQHVWIFSHGRYLTTSECALLQGLDPRRVSVVVSDAQFGAMLGNSMSVDVLKAILGAVMPALMPAAESAAVT